MTEDEALDLLRMCIAELETRFVGKLGNFMVRVVDKTGVRVVDLAAKGKVEAVAVVAPAVEDVVMV